MRCAFYLLESADFDAVLAKRMAKGVRCMDAGD